MATKKIYAVKEEFSNDGEITCNFYPCKTKGLAVTLKERIKTMWNTMETHFKGEIFNNDTAMEIDEDTNESFVIIDPNDSYYLDVKVIESDVLETMADLSNVI